jgi:hypothetical protein
MDAESLPALDAGTCNRKIVVLRFCRNRRAKAVVALPIRNAVARPGDALKELLTG